MTKSDHIGYWRKESERNWETALYLVAGRQFVMGLFMFHLVIEKLLKAHWVKDNVDNFPPRTHDLQLLHNQTELDLPAEDYDFLAVISQWSIDTRYPDYKNKIYSIATEDYIGKQQQRIKTLLTCLQEQL